MGRYLLWLAVLCHTIATFINAYRSESVLEDLEGNIKRSFDLFNSNYVEGPGGPDSMLSIGVPEHFKCPKLPKPKNGVVRCGGTLCLVQCNEGYIQHRKHAFVYQCGRTNSWTTIPKNRDIPWPDCVKMPPFAK